MIFSALYILFKNLPDRIRYPVPGINSDYLHNNLRQNIFTKNFLAFIKRIAPFSFATSLMIEIFHIAAGILADNNYFRGSA